MYGPRNSKTFSSYQGFLRAGVPLPPRPPGSVSEDCGRADRQLSFRHLTEHRRFDDLCGQSWTDRCYRRSRRRPCPGGRARGDGQQLSDNGGH